MIKLNDLQIETIEKIGNHQRFLVANEMRTGKTLTILQKMKDIYEKDKTKKHLIIVPTKLILQWSYEFERIFGFLPTLINYQKAKDRYIFDGEFFGIIGYQRFANDIQKITNYRWDTTIVDEVHMIAKRDTKQGKSLIKINRKTKNLFLLTATPITNKIENFWTILHLLDKKKFASYWGYINKYCLTEEVHLSKSFTFKKIVGWNEDNLVELKQWYNKYSCKYKLNNQDLGSFFNEQAINFDDNEDILKLYKKLKKEKEFIHNDIYISLFSNCWILTALNYLKIFSIFPEKFGFKNQKTDWIKEFIKENKHIIITSSSLEYLKFLHGELKEGELLCGKSNSQEKQMIVNNFQNGTNNLLLAQSQVLEGGWTLNKAESIVFIDLPYNCVSKDQIIGRILDPIHNEVKRIKDIYILIENTIGYDKNVFETIIKKKEIFSPFNDNITIEEFWKMMK